MLLHMVAEIDRDLPVLMIDSLMLFEETLEYQRDLSRAPRADATCSTCTPTPPTSRGSIPDDTLHQRDPDACCVIRKVAPLDRALRRWPVTITGRKRFQASTRAALEVFEADDRAAEGQPAGALAAGGHPRLHGRARPAAPSAGGQGLPLDRLRALHHPRGARARTSAPGAGAAARRSSAAFISARMDASCAWRAEGRAMTILVTERGFGEDDWTGEVLPFDIFWSGQDLPEEGLAVEFPNDRDPADLAPWLERLALIRVAFPAMCRRARLLHRAAAPGHGLCRPAARRRAAGRRPASRRPPRRLRRDRAARGGGRAAARGACGASGRRDRIRSGCWPDPRRPQGLAGQGGLG